MYFKWKYIDENSLSTTRRGSIQREVQRAKTQIQPDME